MLLIPIHKHITPISLSQIVRPKHPIRRPIVNAKRIWLKSIELPVGFSNIRSTNFSNTLTVNTASTGGTSYTITLPDRIYTSIQQLLHDINLFFIATYTGDIIDISTIYTYTSTFIDYNVGYGKCLI